MRSVQRPERRRASVSPDAVGAPSRHRRGEPLLGSRAAVAAVLPCLCGMPAQRGDALAAAVEVVDHVRASSGVVVERCHRRTDQVALSLDDRGVDAHEAGGTAVAVEAFEGQLGAAAAELDRIVVDDRDRRVVDARRVEVTEGDDGRRPPPRAQPGEQPDRRADVGEKTAVGGSARASIASTAGSTSAAR